MNVNKTWHFVEQKEQNSKSLQNYPLVGSILLAAGPTVCVFATARLNYAQETSRC